MRHSPTSRARSLVVAVLAGLLPAACATTRYTQSAVVAVPAEARGKAGSNASIEVEGLKVRIETLDRAPEKATLPRLRLRVVFDPPELGYSFDPGQVVLRSGDGGEWRAPGGEYRPVYPKASFNLAFDAAVPEEGDFELVLGGLARGEKRLEPVTLRLARRNRRSIDRVYWLEALLAPLAYAPYVP
jgi:hypothetical protein